MNRALEFLIEAQKQHYAGWKAREFVRLAMAEVYELLEENTAMRRRIATLEAPSTLNDGGEVVIIETRTISTGLLKANSQAALSNRTTQLSK